MIKYRTETKTEPIVDAGVEMMSLTDQIAYLEEHVQLLEEIQRQLSEVKGHESSVEKQALESYLKVTADKIREIEASLDKGLIGLSQSEIGRPEMAELKVAEPKIDKTPYTAEINELTSFFHEIRDSELAKRGTKDFANGLVKKRTLPLHL